MNHDIHWHNWWIYDYDAINKVFHKIENAGLLVVEWNYADDKMLILVFDIEDNVLLLWRFFDESEEE